MSTAASSHKQRGFQLLELLIATAVFLVVAGAVFGMLSVAQTRFTTESQVLDSFQEARLGLDQIGRDFESSGYPPQNQFSALPPSNYALSPVAWSPNYVANNPCLIGSAGGGSCTSPGDFDLIVETNIYPQQAGSTVQWVRYQLQGTTLFRGIAGKTAGADPAAATSVAGVMVPFAHNIMNNASAATIAQIRASYSALFPNGNPQPIFQFTCDIANATPLLCQNAGANNSPKNVRDVQITLIVQTQQTDAQTGVPRVVTLSGLGHRVNPNQ